MRLALNVVKKSFWKIIKVCEKSPIGSHLSLSLCEDINQTHGCHCPPPPPLQTHQASFPQVIWCPCWVESNRALRRCKPVWTSPLVLWTLWNTISKCPLCSIVINIFLSWNNISGFTFLLIWIRINEQTKVIKLVMQLAPPFIKVLKETIFYVCLIVLIFYFC